MAFDTIRLEKGLYTTDGGFTAALETLDPSGAYAGTDLEGLDAYQRQLKRFDIKIAGADSDPVAKFFQTTDSSALFPEYIARAVRQGMEEADHLQRILATTTKIDSMDYRAIESVPAAEDKTLAAVAEGAKIPETVVRTKETLTPLYKRGRMLVASYEAVKFQRLDLFTITLKQIGAYIARSQFWDALEALCQDIEVLHTSSASFTYSDLVDLWSTFSPYQMTTLLASAKDTASLLKLTEMQDAAAGLNFHGTGKMITPFGAELIKTDFCPAGGVLALDRTCALEKVQAGDVQTDYDRLIDRQLERAAITAIAGFSVIFRDSAKVMELTA